MDWLEQDAQSLEDIARYCNKVDLGFECKSCVCTSRNKRVEIFRLKYESYMDEAKKEALERFGADISKNIEEIREKHIYPWEIENNCSNEYGPSISILCDEQEILGAITNPGKTLQYK